MKYTRFLILLVIGASLMNGTPLHSEQKYKLSLEQAIKTGLTSGYQIRLAQEALSMAQAKNLEAWNGFLPSITFSESFMKSTDPVTVFGLKLKQGVFTQQDFSLSSLNNPDVFENYSTQIKLELPILNVDAFYHKSAMSASVHAQKANLERTRQSVVFQIKAAYYGLILAYQNLQAVKDALRVAQIHRDEAKLALEQGLLTRADYLLTEVRVQELKEEALIAENNIRDASDQFKFLIGMQEKGLIEPTDSLVAPGTSPLNFSEGVNPALRADVQALHFQQVAAHRQLKAARSAWFPRLNAFGSYEWNDNRFFGQDASNWMIGVQLSWKLFDGLGNWGRHHQASARVREATIAYQQAYHQASNEANSAYRKISIAQQRYQVAQKALQQASESLRLIRERFEVGLVKTSELLEHELQYTRARLRSLKAKFDYHVALDQWELAHAPEEREVKK